MKISQALAMLAFLAASCSEQYLVNGNSSVQSLEGKTLYLKVFDNDEMRTIDSSGVVHGKFRFNGLLDSVMMGNVFFGEQSVMPIVIESGKVTLQIDETMQSATGTPLNDKSETLAIKLALGETAAREAVISSTKSMMGHMLGATGAIELVICAKTLQTGKVAPTIHLDQPDPECDLDYTPHTARDYAADMTISNSFGFGGQNACVALRRI